jgi:hypothetical protein
MLVTTVCFPQLQPTVEGAVRDMTLLVALVVVEAVLAAKIQLPLLVPRVVMVVLDFLPVTTLQVAVVVLVPTVALQLG